MCRNGAKSFSRVRGVEFFCFGAQPALIFKRWSGNASPSVVAIGSSFREGRLREKSIVCSSSFREGAPWRLPETGFRESDIGFENERAGQLPLEEALRLKESRRRSYHALDGPERVKQTIKEALAKGADRGFTSQMIISRNSDPLDRQSPGGRAAKRKSDLVDWPAERRPRIRGKPACACWPAGFTARHHHHAIDAGKEN